MLMRRKLLEDIFSELKHPPWTAAWLNWVREAVDNLLKNYSSN